MGRPRKYLDDAEKQAAYRARLAAETATVDRAALDALHERLDALQTAIHGAAARGDETARIVGSANIETLLENLAAHFDGVAREV
jgi:hypothetical protein